MTLEERVTALQAREADAAQKLAAAKAHEAGLREEMARTTDEAMAAEADLAAARHADPADRAAVEVAAAKAGANRAIVGSVAADVVTAESTVAEAAEEHGRVARKLEEARTNVLAAGHKAVASQEHLRAATQERCARALHLYVELKGVLSEIDFEGSRAEHAEGALRALGQHMPVLDVALHALLPLLELKAHMGHGPAIGTGLNEIRNNILVRRQVDANGLASLTSRLSVASFVALVEALKPLPQVHADAWLARLKAFRSVRNTREADVQERADAKAAEAVRAESYVAPTPASRMPREPWQRPGGPPTFVHSLSPMAVLAARGADLATRVAASASRLGKVGKS